MIACPICGSRTRVTETRSSGKSARRRRGCSISRCTGKVTTIEVVVPEGAVSVLAHGAVVVPARQIAKLRAALAKTTSSPGRQIARLREIVDSIEERAL